MVIFMPYSKTLFRSSTVYIKIGICIICSIIDQADCNTVVDLFVHSSGVFQNPPPWLWPCIHPELPSTSPDRIDQLSLATMGGGGGGGALKEAYREVYRACC